MPLATETVVVGSDPQAHVPIRADLGVTARHYELRPMLDGRHQVVSLVRESPVFVNGQSTMTGVLSDGDVICAGSLQLMYRNEAAVRPPAVASQPPPLPAQLPPPVSPPQLSATMALPVTGRRMPWEVPLPEQDEDMEGFSETVKRKVKAEKLMRESLDRTQQRLEELKTEQNFNLALLIAVVALVAGGLGYMQAAGLTWKLWLPATAAIGFGVGWLVRVSGKGIDRCFGYLAAGTAILCIAGANLASYQVRMAEYSADEEMTATAEESEYAQETPEEQAERLKREEQTRREDEQRAALFEAEAREMEAQFRRQSGYAFNPDDKAEGMEAEEAEPEAEDPLADEPVQKEPAQPPLTMGLFAIAWLLFNPKSIVGYFVIGGAAYRAAFRSLTNEEASALHLGGERAEDMSGMSLRERIQFGREK